MNTYVTGQCLCGQVRYRAARAPERAGHCHCDMCRRASGAVAFTLAVFERDDIEWHGTVKHYQSSATAKRGFCAECGSALTYEPTKRPSKVMISIGTMDNPEQVPAEFNIFTRERISWLRLDEHLEDFSGSMDEHQ